MFCACTETTGRIQAEAALRENEARLRFLDRLGRETAKSTDADAMLATTTRMVAEHLQISNCAYADMDPDEDGFTIRGDWAAPGSPSIVGHYSLADFGKRAVRDLSAGRPLVIHDNLKELAPEEAATFQAIGIAATICMPLIKDGRLTALMAIHDRVPRVLVGPRPVPDPRGDRALLGPYRTRSRRRRGPGGGRRRSRASTRPLSSGSRNAPRGSWRPKRRCANRRSWRRSASSRAASRTTSTTC